MGPCEREARHAVIEGSSVPPFGRVAIRAICQGKCRTSRRVHGIVRLLPCGQMAPGRAASSRRNLQVVIVVDVARSAGHIRMAVSQREPSK